ncbi:putative entry exclusion protein TrbK-alt [Roseomonas gilardii subsp. gilardii]|uniref:putative entry exclusion protein TrbK-alt n=1 Tax=Roseomonas gilardii TaxID=257708 RepID=UPI001FF88342|nr:putative entry exclusion protein TrbK-alt [Roseomonas gilardii]UPG72932.1 putative entry exclusion protein TrbK-alt [Roseomonas gilardii subsp. gilardii]
MDGKVLARLGAIIFVAIAITATVIEMTRKDEPEAVTTAPQLQPSADPLRQSLRRCQRLGEAAASDPGCLSTWAENRDRFLGRTPVPAAPHQNGGQ